jgi:hypothetical protein
MPDCEQEIQPRISRKREAMPANLAGGRMKRKILWTARN